MKRKEKNASEGIKACTRTEEYVAFLLPRKFHGILGELFMEGNRVLLAVAVRFKIVTQKQFKFLMNGSLVGYK